MSHHYLEDTDDRDHIDKVEPEVKAGTVVADKEKVLIEIEYVVYIAHLVNQTTREERLLAYSEEKAKKASHSLCKESEFVVKVEEACEHTYRVMIEKTQVFRTYIKADSYEEARTEALQQIEEDADAAWEWRDTPECKISDIVRLDE